jgi:hypothetical protein
LSGEEIVVGGAGLAAGTLMAARYGSKLIGKAGGLGAGVGVGKALESAAGAPVYVVNMPSAGVGGIGVPGFPACLAGQRLARRPLQRAAGRSPVRRA